MKNSIKYFCFNNVENKMMFLFLGMYWNIYDKLEFILLVKVGVKSYVLYMRKDKYDKKRNKSVFC